MDRRRHPEQPRGSRLARSYLAVRAEQSAEPRPAAAEDEVRASVTLPRLDSVHLSSPEAQAQFRLAVLARMASSDERWFMLADRTPR